MRTWSRWLVSGVALLGVVSLQAETPCPECEAAVAAKPATKPASAPQIQSAWNAPEARPWVIPQGTILENQDGKKVDLSKLAQPLVVSFIYTRCQNPRKCPRVSRTMGELAELVRAKGLSDRACLALVTYDPEFDTPAVMSAHGQQLGVTFGKDFMMLRPAPEKKQELFGNLGIGVNFDRRGEVNAHANQLLVIDAQGRLARKYEVLLWKNEDVLGDLERLLAEPQSPPEPHDAESGAPSIGPARP